ncbi:MAG TPA: hypothetical protein VLT83_12000 [Opitutaceae bacterium]|nr:hypothetical protein [Opitutaceae bacterium]
MKRTSSRRRGFAVRAGKTIAASAPATFAAWASARRRARWLSGVNLTVRRATAPKSLDLVCEDGSHIEVRITARGRASCRVAVDHTGLASAQQVMERRHCWREMLRGLAQYLARQS